DNTFETSFGHRRNTNSSISDMSFSSEMDSMSPMSSSLNSICPADVRDTEVQGSIQFALTYIQKLGEFQIFVVLCRGLAVADPKKNRTDYVKCSLLPDKTKLGKKKTSVKKKTLSPTYNEVLGFKIPMEVLRIQHLNITVSHKDTFGRSSFLGEVDLDLSVWDFSNTQINEFPLKAKVGEVQIWVKDCKNLLPVRGSMINPFVTVLPDMSSKSRQKTRVVKRTVNPMFNHTMVYEGFRLDDLREICVEITVWDQDHLKNYYIGGLRLGLGTRSYEVDVVWMDSTAHEVNLWNRMLKSNAEWVEEVLPLR
uniref:Synaptotagmin-like 2a n=1 Tax=Oryzias latipes TaxID=8090 RepID=A0A3B3HSB8_ORYLA